MKKLFCLVSLFALLMGSIPVVYANDDVFEEDLASESVFTYENACSYVGSKNNAAYGWGAFKEEAIEFSIFDNRLNTNSASGYNAVTKYDTITITNNAPNDAYTMYLTFEPYYECEDGSYSLGFYGEEPLPGSFYEFYYYVNDKRGDGDTWYDAPVAPAFDSDVVKIKPGESVTTTLPQFIKIYDGMTKELRDTSYFAEDILWKISVTLLYNNNPEKHYYEDAYSLWWLFKIDNDAVAERTAEVEGYMAKNIFSDVSVSDYFFGSVIWALDNNITKGISETEFGPNETCTHAQILTFLWRATGSEVVEGCDVNGIDKDAYYYDAVRWANSKGMLEGITSFDANVDCSRLDAVWYIWNAKDRDMENVDEKVVVDLFEDVEEDSLKTSAIAWAYANGVTKGTSSSTFSPKNTCTRGQIITFLCRAFE